MIVMGRKQLNTLVSLTYQSWMIIYHLSQFSIHFLSLVRFSLIFVFSLVDVFVQEYLFSLLEVALVVNYFWVVYLCSKCQVFRKEDVKCLLGMASYISFKNVFHLFLVKLIKSWFFDWFSFIVSQNLSGSVYSS